MTEYLSFLGAMFAVAVAGQCRRAAQESEREQRTRCPKTNAGSKRELGADLDSVKSWWSTSNYQTILVRPMPGL